MQLGSWSQIEEVNVTAGRVSLRADRPEVQDMSMVSHSNGQTGSLDTVTSTGTHSFDQRPTSTEFGGPTNFQTEILNDVTPAELLTVDESRWSTGAATQHDIAQLGSLADLYSILGCHQLAFLLSRRLILLHESHNETDYTRLSLSPDIFRMVINATERLDLKQVEDFVGNALGQRDEFQSATTPHMCLLQSHLGVLNNDARAAERRCTLAVTRYKELMAPEKLDFRFLAVLANLTRVKYRSETKQTIVPNSQRSELVLSLSEVYLVVTRLFHLLCWCLERLGNGDFGKMYQDCSEELWSEDVAINALEYMEHRLVFCYLYQHWMNEMSMSQGGYKSYVCNPQLWAISQNYHLCPHDTLMALALMIVQLKDDERRQKATLQRRVLSQLSTLTRTPPLQMSHEQDLCKNGQRLLHTFIDAHLVCLHMHHHRFPKGQYGTLLQRVLLDFVDKNLTLSLSNTIFTDLRVRNSSLFAHAETNVAHATLTRSPTSTMSDMDSMRRISKKARTRNSTVSVQAGIEDEQRPNSRESSTRSTTSMSSMPMSPLNIETDDDHVDVSRFSQDMDEYMNLGQKTHNTADENMDDVDFHAFS
jgi:hypothetical protein